MATPVQMYKASDGKIFPTEREADAHIDFLMLVRRYPQQFEMGSCGLESSNYAIFMAVLQDFELRKREYVAAGPSRTRVGP